MGGWVSYAEDQLQRDARSPDRCIGSLAVLEPSERLREELGSERLALNTKQQHLAELDVRLSRDQKSVGTWSDAQRATDGSRQMSVQVEKSREKLARAARSARRTRGSARSKSLRSCTGNRELEIDRLVALVENARGEIDKVPSERETLAGELAPIKATWPKLADLEQQTASKDSARQEAARGCRAALPALRADSQTPGTALAHTGEGTCSACHMRSRQCLPAAHAQRTTSVSARAAIAFCTFAQNGQQRIFSRAKRETRLRGRLPDGGTICMKACGPCGRLYPKTRGSAR